MSQQFTWGLSLLPYLYKWGLMVRLSLKPLLLWHPHSLWTFLFQLQPWFLTSSSSSGPDPHLCIPRVDQSDPFLTYFDHDSFVRPWKHNTKNKSSECSGGKFKFSAMPEILLLRWEGQQMVNPPGPVSMALWLLCLCRAESFLIWMLSLPPHPPASLHQALMAQTKHTGIAHCSLWAGEAFS